MAQSPSPAQTPSSPQAPSHESPGCLATLVRLSWLVLGNGALALLALLIAQAGRFSVRDVLYWGVVVAMIALRHLDVTRLHGRTASFEPATLRDWRRYTARLLLVATAAWAAAHLLLRSIL